MNEHCKFNMTEHTILYGYRGSKAHNLYIPSTEIFSTDDVDLMGVVIAPLDYYFGLYHFEGAEFWEGENDVVIYELRKFVRLLIKANPNVLSFLWNTPEMFITKHPVGQILLDNRSLFSTKACYGSFGGYAKSQLHKMFSQSYQGYMGAKRKQIVNEFGYDTKNASHLIRLLRMGIEMLKTGGLTVFRTTDRQELIDIKQGRWTAERVQRNGELLFAELRAAHESSTLPDTADLVRVNNVLMQMMNLAVRLRQEEMFK